jgi:hypothetical protein
MIRYTLVCDKGHEFESWFRDIATFEAQAAAEQLSCPACQSSHVGRAIMAPAITQGGRGLPEASNDQAIAASQPGPGAPDSSQTALDQGAAMTATDTEATPSQDVALLDSKDSELRQLVRQVKERLLAEAQDVGSRFATEARRMHFGEIPSRQIYGVASPTEVRDLLDDGVAVLPMPVLPDELN